MKLVVVCEAPGDFALAACLVTRSLRAHGPRWFDDLEEIVDFSGWSDSERQELVLWTDLESAYRRRFGRPLQGRNTGPYSLPALQAILLAEREADVTGLILMVDLDREPERRRTLLILRDGAASLPFSILVATPNPKREAWVLHGFEPANQREEKRLAALSRELGFDPRLEPHRLRDDARRVETRRDIKQVLDHLLDNDRRREPPCWEEVPLELLEARGNETFLVEIRERLLPRLAGGSSS